jgi:tetratricopeptide (TPR) repeat protein
MKIYQFPVRFYVLLSLFATPVGEVLAVDDAIIDKNCVEDSTLCEDQYERYLKKKNQSRGFFRREITKRRAYPYINRAFALLDKGKVDRAISELNKYLAADPGHNLVRWYHLVMISSQGDYSKLIEPASNFIKHTKENGPALLIRGNAYIKLGDMGKAEKDFLAARSKKLYGHAQNKDITWTLYNIAYGQADYKKAKKWLDELPAKEKNTPEYKVIRANILEKNGKRDEAISFWKKLMGDRTDKEIRLKALTALGRLYEKKTDYSKALQYYLRALEIEDNIRIRLDAAEAAWKISDYQKIQQLLEPIAKNEVPVEQKDLELKALKALARLHGKTTDYNRALEYYSKALTLQEDTSVRLSAAETAWMLQDYQSTQSLLEPLIQNGSIEGDRIFGLRQRYCEALDKSGKEEQASSCLADLLKDYPAQSALLSYSADLAFRRGENNEYIRSLKGLYAHQPSAKIASSIAYALEKEGKWVDAERWHQTAYSSEDDDPVYAIAYAGSLLSNGDAKTAKGIFQEITKNPESTPAQREYAYNNLASLYFHKKAYAKADDAWRQASLEDSKPIYDLRRIVTNNLAGKHATAYKIASRYGTRLPKGLAEKYHHDWYAAAGEAYYKNKDYKKSQAVFERLAQSKSTSAYFLLLAESYRANGDYEKSNEAYLQAESLSSKKDFTLKERAYMYLQAGMEDKAMPLLEEMRKENPNNASISENLGYYSLRKNHNKEAASYFRSALAAYNAQDPSPENSEAIEAKRDTLTQLISKLEKRWSVSLFDGLCIGSSACDANSNNLVSPFGQGFGQAQLDYRLSSTTHIFTRGLWHNKKDSLAVDRRSFQPTLGVGFKPIKGQNLLISIEYMFEGGPDTENHVLLRSAWSKTKGNDWSLKDSHDFKGRKLGDYSNLYADVGKLFLNEDPFLLYAEGRKGKTLIFNKQSLISGFGYLRGSGEFASRSNDEHVIDIGVGVEGRYRAHYNQYRGYRTEWSALLRVGQELDNTQDKEDTRINLGIGLHF